MNLQQFTPAENLLIIKGEKPDFGQQMKFTLADLIFKEVLQIITIEKQTHPKDPVTSSAYVVHGKNFYTYHPQPHELVFLQPYIKSKTVKILFRHLVKMGFENAKSPNSFGKTIENGRIKKYFNNGYFSRAFWGRTLNDEGKNLKHTLDGEIEKIKRDLFISPASALQIAALIFGNIYLADAAVSLPGQMVPDLEKQIAYNNDVPGSSYGWSSCGSWSSFDSHSGCGGSGCGSSGCSSSGCSSSGCSGCGGCGS